jgi:hypothetical protein
VRRHRPGRRRGRGGCAAPLRRRGAPAGAGRGAWPAGALHPRAAHRDTRPRGGRGRAPGRACAHAGGERAGAPSGGEFSLAFQPVVDLCTGEPQASRPCCAGATRRSAWCHRRRSSRSPRSWG